jgi:uncharacterized LabA/DUF88 family protein
MVQDNVQRLSIFVDGGYFNMIQATLGINFEFTKFTNTILEEVSNRLNQKLELLHVFYYDSLPYTSVVPTEDEKSAVSKRKGFFGYLRTIPGVRVREGYVTSRMVNGKPMLSQKKVDILLGLDIAEHSQKGLMKHLVLVSGDGDLVPAVEFASSHSVQVWLVHGPKGLIGPKGTETSYSEALWTLADGRIELVSSIIEKVRK